MMKTRWQIEPVGTVRPAWHGKLWVVGRSGAYLYDVEAGCCSCPHFLNRLRPGDRCRHRQDIEAYLWRQQMKKGSPSCTKFS